MIMEYILCAAIHKPGELDLSGTGPLIYCGLRHHNILWQGTQVSRTPSHQGFLTSTGRFVTRQDAKMIAFKAGQLDKIKQQNNHTLYSEDLY